MRYQTNVVNDQFMKVDNSADNHQSSKVRLMSNVLEKLA